MPSDGTTRRARWSGLLRLAVQRTVARTTRESGRQTILSILGVAVAVALLVLVTSVGLGFTAGATTRGTSANYWVVPEGSAGSAVTGVEGQNLGQVHSATARIQKIDGVTRATPVLSTLLKVSISDESEYVLVVGVIASEETEIMGLSTARLTPGDPYYANGSYDGYRTGEAVLSPGAFELLALSDGEQFTFTGVKADTNATFSALRSDRTTAGSQFPVAVVHLSELQVLTGAADGDMAEQIQVTAEPRARDEIASVYPGTDVLSRTGLLRQEARNSKTTLAVGVAALVVALVVGVLSMVTTLGFDIMSDAHNYAIMAAFGVSQRSRIGLISVQTLTVAVIGGIVGLGFGGSGIILLNTASRMYYSVPVARFHPYLLPYGIAVAVLIGLLAAPYLMFVGRRMDVYERLGVR